VKSIDIYAYYNIFYSGNNGPTDLTAKIFLSTVDAYKADATPTTGYTKSIQNWTTKGSNYSRLVKTVSPASWDTKSGSTRRQKVASITIDWSQFPANKALVCELVLTKSGGSSERDWMYEGMGLVETVDPNYKPNSKNFDEYLGIEVTEKTKVLKSVVADQYVRRFDGKTEVMGIAGEGLSMNAITSGSTSTTGRETITWSSSPFDDLNARAFAAYGVSWLNPWAQAGNISPYYKTIEVYVYYYTTSGSVPSSTNVKLFLATMDAYAADA
jgi:hypothetical protein